MKLTLITATYNRANEIKKQIKRILNQSFKDFEYIIVDDNSNDKTKDVILSFNDKRIIYLKNQANLGTNKSVLKALDIAKGKFIALIADDDEFIDNDFFKKAMQYNEDIISAKYETVLNGKVIKNGFKCKKEILNTNEALNIFNQFVFGGNTIFKKELLKRVMSYDFKHDFSIIFFALINAKSIRFINDTVFRWYLETDSNSFTAKLLRNPYKLLKWDLRFLDEVIPILEKENRYQKFKWFFEKRIFEIFENVEFNYFLSKREEIFNKLLSNIDKEVYIYGAGQIGVLLKEFLEKNNIKVLGVVDDYKKGYLDINDIDKSKQVIIASLKKKFDNKNVFKINKK